MIVSSMDFIDISSDDEDEIIDLCSDSEDSTDLRSDRGTDLDYEDPDIYFQQPPVSLSATSDKTSAEQPVSLEDDDWLDTTQASSSYMPADNKSATEMSGDVTNHFAPVNHGSSVEMPYGAAHAIPDDQSIDTKGTEVVRNDNKRTLPLLLTNGPATNAPIGAHQFPDSFTKGSPNDLYIDYLSAFLCNDNKGSLPSLLTNGATAKSEYVEAPNGTHQFPQSVTKESPKSFSSQLFASSHSNLSDNKVKEELTVPVHFSPLFASSHSSLSDNAVKEEPTVPVSFNPQSFVLSHSSLLDDRIKEEPAVKFNGFQSCAANGNGMCASATPTDDVCVYGGPRSHRVFPPPMPSKVSINGAGVDNGVEKKAFGVDERAVYEEALQNINNQEKGEEDLPEGVMSVSLLKHQKIALAWMVSKENNPHCPGGILADDQGLGKTISTIALIQKERVQQSRFMSADSYQTKSVLNIDDDDEVVVVMDKKRLKAEPLNKLDDSAPLHVATSLKLCANQPSTASDRKVKTSKVEPKMKLRVSSSAPTLKPKSRSAAGTLVVCPASVLKQWANELSVKVTERAKLSVLVYHGASRTKDPTKLATHDVVVTTYTTVANEVPKNPDDELLNCERYGVCPEVIPGSKRKEPPVNKKTNCGPLAKVRWFRVVLDEAQTIKNYRTKMARACCELSAERRWCLSGTPIQNKIDDLFSYFCFLKYEPYCKASSFASMIKSPISKDPVRGYKKLQAILRIFLLRRTKETLIDGEPIIKLPPKTIELSRIDFTHEERAFYLALEEGSRQKFKAYDAAGTIQNNYANILVMLLRLRQACDHPILLKDQQSELIDNSSIERAKQLPNETVTNLVEKLESGPAICSICSDPPEDALVSTCGHVFCYQCVYARLISDGNVCPFPLCGKQISAETVFPPAVLKLCTLPKLESSAATSCSSAEDKSSAIFESSYISSKIRAAIENINSILSTHALTGGDTIGSIPSEITPVKAIIFTQWTGMLDLLELSLSSNHIQFRRLDGTMSLNARDIAVKEFNIVPEVRVMIMSLKAGNLGLNMVAACHVIMLDPWWNPYAEDQAVDRAHRIGQTRPVTVSRLTVKDTVEDRILALQGKKREMVQSAFGEDKSSGNSSRLTVEDLRYLFMV